MNQPIANIVFVAGKKLAGKDYLCDLLVAERGYHKFHIVHPWLMKFCERHGIPWSEYEQVKAKWRAQIQIEATEARNKNPNVLVDEFRALLPSLPRPLCVTAVRFKNEGLLGREIGALIVRVDTPDDVRRQRFIDKGEDLSLFNDPFESEIDSIPAHTTVCGDWPKSWFIPALEKATFLKEQYQR